MTKTGKLFLGIGIAVFLFLYTGSGFLHNHQADLFTHDDCPAYLISVTLVGLSFFAALLLKNVFPKPFTAYIPKNINFCTSILVSSINNKAPPF